MNSRFTVDLLHPGRVARTWQDWFVGTQGRRRLLLAAVGSGVVLVIVAAFPVVVTLRLAGPESDLPRLRQDLARRDGDVRVLKADLQALAVEAKRQVRWAEVMTAFSQQIPPTLKLLRVEALRTAAAAPAPGQPPAGGQQPSGEGELRIEAVTPLKPGSPNMLEIAQFMAGLMKDSAVNKRFQLKNWEIKPTSAAVTVAAPSAGPAEKFLQITIVLSEIGR